ncbi:MAG: rhodanese-like domain-containing protein [Gammaproteobacteria bacterium]|nr:rhodanese-like domain-containing protein [Gammaproteobacteria bacterium]MCW8923440.1 rhodanese-like domain-containing protein [Gammaproteobacteria bacterium]
MNGELSCEKLQQLLNNGAQLIDVRSTMEFNQGALNGAINLPINSIQHNTGVIDQNKPVLLYCRSGARSGMVKNFLISLGFQDVYNIGSYSKYAFC